MKRHSVKRTATSPTEKISGPTPGDEEVIGYGR
jgi:hypothetical protein